MSNYKGIVATIQKTIEIPNADNIQIGVVLGEYTVVSKSAKEGDIGILFPAGTQLSQTYCHHNNLFRDSAQNVDTTKKGFFDDNRKVRCQKFMGVKSEAYFATLDSVAFTGVDMSSLISLFSFEELNGVGICQKFIGQDVKVKVPKDPKDKKPKVKAFPFFKEHVDTAQYKHESYKINKGDLISVQSKRHGTSQRSGIQLVVKKLPKWKMFVNKWLGGKFKQEEEYQHVVGTRRVVLNSPEKCGFHGVEAFRFEVAEKIHPFLSEGMTAYYEIYGYVNGKPIMPKHDIKSLKNKEYEKKYGKEVVYKYGCLEGIHDFHIYRLTYTTHSGQVIDFTQPQLVQWCRDRDLKPSLDVIEPFVFDGDFDKLNALVEELTERPEVLTEDYTDPTHPSEGVIVRVDRQTMTPLFLKSKSFAFRVMEGITQDNGVVDIEDAQGLVEEETVSA